jgi:hypothetical protein
MYDEILKQIGQIARAYDIGTQSQRWLWQKCNCNKHSEEKTINKKIKPRLLLIEQGKYS